MGPNLREAIPRQYGTFLPINGSASLTRRPERISKWEIFGSPNRIRTQDLLVNTQVFGTLCLRVFSAFCDLLALSAHGTGGASERQATAATGSPKPSPRKRNERESAQARCRRCRFRGRGASPSLAWSSARWRRRAVRAGWAAAAFGGPGRCHASNTAVTPARPRQGFAEAQRRCRLRWPARGLRGRHGVSCAAPVPLWAGDPKRRAQTSTTVAVPRRGHRDLAEGRRRYLVRAWPPPACCRALTRAIPIWHISWPLRDAAAKLADGAESSWHFVI